MNIKGMALSCAIMLGELFSVTAFADCQEAAANFSSTSNGYVCYKECTETLKSVCGDVETHEKCKTICVDNFDASSPSPAPSQLPPFEHD